MFGIHLFGKDTAVSDVLLEIEAGSVTDVQAQLLLLEAYLISYGIVDDLDTVEEERPLIHVAAHPKENLHDGFRTFSVLDAFMDRKVGELLHMGYREFIQMPREFVDHVLNKAYKASVSEAKIVKDLVNGNR